MAWANKMYVPVEHNSLFLRVIPVTYMRRSLTMPVSRSVTRITSSPSSYSYVFSSASGLVTRRRTHLP